MIIASQTSRLYLDPVLPLPLIILLAALIISLTMAVYLRDMRRVGTGRLLTFTAFRILGTFGLFLILLNPQREVVEKPKEIKKKVIIAIDHSESMAQTDLDSISRIEEAKTMLEGSKLIEKGRPVFSGIHFHTFGESARRIQAADLRDLRADGPDTRFHRSLTEMLQSADSGNTLAGLILISDGHDHELVNPARTALEARNRKAPIFALPVGSDRSVRDASIRIASYQPYIFVGQHARIDVALRLIGCEYEDFTMELYREGKRIARRQVAVGDEIQRLESFEVLEDEPGQYAYEVRLSQVENEANRENNSATTFLNVSNKKIRLLLLEGAPYWDTNFTQRSLWGNDKFDIDIATAVAEGRTLTLRKNPNLGELKIPGEDFEFDAYDCVLLGNQVERLLDDTAQQGLADYVKNFRGNVVFLRGKPTLESGPLDAISPVEWQSDISGFSELEVDAAGRSTGPFKLLNLHAGQKSLRPIVSVQAAEPRELSTVMASARMPGQRAPVPTMVHRRAGRGQVLAIASTGLWRTGFHSDLLDSSALFDPFWDNLILWLISGRNVHSDSDYSLMLNTANLALGQSIHLRMTAKNPESLPMGVPVELYRDGDEAALERGTLSPDEQQNQLTAQFTPTRPGIYRIDVPLPDGKSELLRFAVYNDNRESSEVSVDRPFLEQLSIKSGGRVIAENELYPLVEDLVRDEIAEPIVRREPAWNSALWAWIIALCFAMDWLLRRRGGLC
ncbi:MAG: hypothetical protein R6U56_10450 [Opitutales bacterium]